MGMVSGDLAMWLAVGVGGGLAVGAAVGALLEKRG